MQTLEGIQFFMTTFFRLGCGKLAALNQARFVSGIPMGFQPRRWTLAARTVLGGSAPRYRIRGERSELTPMYVSHEGSSAIWKGKKLT